MSGRELIPPGRDENGTDVHRIGLPVLPGTVAASHLAAAATGLAEGTASGRAGACVGTVTELAELADQLVTGQRQVSVALGQLARHLHGMAAGPARARTAERTQLTALAEVLYAAATATGHAAAALAESRPVFDLVRDNEDEIPL